MSVVEIGGYIGAVLTGLVLGLLGGGGAVISIPILVYAFGVPAGTATGYSLLIICITALLGSVQNLRKGLVKYRPMIYCGLPAIAAIYITRRYLIHRLPAVFFTLGSYTVTKDIFILLLLAFFMLLVARSMIRQPKATDAPVEPVHFGLIILQSLVIGVFIGLTGAGGGFLLIPLLLAYEPMDFRNATATSLLLVAVNSAIGFIGDIQSQVHIDWMFLGSFLVCSIAGVLSGITLSSRLDNGKLKIVFGYAMLTIACYIIFREVLLRLL
jgi:uncharacterized protein